MTKGRYVRMATVFAPEVDTSDPQERFFANGPSAMSTLRSFLKKHFYLLMALACVAFKVVSVLYNPHFIVGGGPNEGSYHPDGSRPLVLWIHNVVFFAWLLFFVFQSGLVNLQKPRSRRFFAGLGGALAAVLCVVGIATAIVKGRQDIANLMGDEAEAYQIIPFFKLFAFGVFAALALRFRKNTELYLQFIFFAAAVILDTAFCRFDLIFRHHAFFPCVDLLIMIGVLRDLYIYRRVQKVYLIVLPALMLTQSFAYYTWSYSSAWWVRIARAMIG